MRTLRHQSGAAAFVAAMSIAMGPLGAAASVRSALYAPTSDASESTADTSEGSAAKQARELARAAFGAGDFEAAIVSFERARELDPDPTDLYNLGRIYEESGDIERALDYYAEFARQPQLTLAERKAATDRIEVLRVAVDVPEDPPAGTEQLAPVPPPRVTRELPPADAPRDLGPVRPMIVSGSVLLGVGSALALGAGIGFGIAARRASDRVDDLAGGTNPGRLSLSEAEELVARGKDFETLQISLAVGGGIIAAVGAGLLAAGLVKRASSRRTARAPTILPQLSGATLKWSFR